ncbi:hypothetical protein [Clostridium massiliamazoniense]|nr:hypothetical protein [Clostridium massiliamazoniense]
MKNIININFSNLVYSKISYTLSNCIDNKLNYWEAQSDCRILC